LLENFSPSLEVNERSFDIYAASFAIDDPVVRYLRRIVREQ